MTITVLGGSAPTSSKHVVDVELLSLHSPDPGIGLQAFVLPTITAALPSESIIHLNWPHLRDLSPMADPSFRRPGRIDLLIGADTYGSLLLGEIRQGPPYSPTAQLTLLRWVVFGPAGNARIPQPHRREIKVAACHAMVTSELSALLQRFWEVEDVSAGPLRSPDDVACEQHFAATYRRDPQGRYIVRLPFRQLPLPAWTDSVNIAVNCLTRLEKRCMSSPEFATKYNAFMTEYLELGHMEMIEDYQPSACTPYYLPHHGVFRGGDATGKLWVVFNASQRTRAGTALNGHLLIGPSLQRDLMAVVIAWRRHAVAVTADIRQMYRQIRVDDRDTDVQRIVWRSAPSQPVRHYRLQTVTYGTACAPYLAIRTLVQLATDEGHRFPRAADALIRQSYVDDILTGTDDLQAAKQLQAELIDLLRAGGFELRKWASNQPAVLQDLPSEWCQSSSSRSIDDDRIKALGLEWSPGLDTFHFRVSLRPDPAVPTKRSMLSAIARLFDPVGWIAPVVVTGKILLQDLWLHGVEWDTPLSGQLVSSWQAFHDKLPDLEKISIPRWIGCHFSEGPLQIHGFADASSRAYAAAVYLRSQRGSSTTVALLAAKTKVAPVKQISIPRLELCGAALLTRLVSLVRAALEISNCPGILWSDSQVVLAWLHGHASRWTTFVANRVSAIQTTLPEAQWRHVPTKDNPADLASRGVAPAALAESSLWWDGPSWLRKDPCNWPSTLEEPVTNLEIRSRVTALASTVQPTWTLVERYSNVTKLWRVTAWCLRFGHNCKPQQRSGSPLRGPLTPTELHASHMVCLKSVQAAAFDEEIAALLNHQQIPRRSPLRRLRPFVDPLGVLRVGGRLQLTGLDFDGKHPAVLPKRSPLSTLLVADAHCRVLHGGPLTTLHHLMSQYCPIQLRTSKGRGHRSTKGYIALFVCLWSKAIHLEVVSDCSAAAFLAAFERFASR